MSDSIPTTRPAGPSRPTGRSGTPGPLPENDHGSDPAAGRFDAALAWFFVIVWGAGFLATKTGLQYTAPFTFLSLRFATAAACIAVWLAISRRSRVARGQPLGWPSTPRQWGHVVVAGLLMHAVNLGGSHYAQYLGMSAGISALLLATQPIFTAVIADRFMGQRLAIGQWLGVLIGLAGVVLVVWHKVDVQAAGLASLAAVGIGLAGITAGTLYQRVFCASVDLRSASMVQLAAAWVVVTPLAFVVEGYKMDWNWALVTSILLLVVFASILAVNVLHGLMRRGHATRVTSLFFLTPVVAVLAEWALFGVVPTALSWLGIVVVCGGVALVSARAASPASASGSTVPSGGGPGQ